MPEQALDIKTLLAMGVSPSDAAEIARLVEQLEVMYSNKGSDPKQAAQLWEEFKERILLNPRFSVPYALVRVLYDTAFGDARERGFFTPVWTPAPESIVQSNIGRLSKDLGKRSYAELYAWSLQHREQFWQTMVDQLPIVFKTPPRSIVDLSGGVHAPQWLPGAQLNIVDSCFQGEKDKTALKLATEQNPNIREVTYRELESLVNRVSNSLVQAGYQKGDALAIYMPLTLEAVAIYLGIIKAGMVVVSIADSNTVTEMRVRMTIAKPKAIFTVDHFIRAGKTIELYPKVVQAQAPRAIVVPNSPIPQFALREDDLAWSDFLSSNEHFDSVACSPMDSITILFSSGTTGEPKAIPWNHTTPIKSAADAWIHTDVRPEDVLAWPTSLGWMMGPWLLFAAFMNRATVALYVGSPIIPQFGEFIRDANVTMLGVIPTMVKGWRKTSSMEGLDWSRIRVFASTGECSNFDDYLWLMFRAGCKPVIEYLGGTEIGGAYMTGTVVQPACPATFTTPTLGIGLVVLEEGKPSKHGEGFLVGPSIGLSTTLLNKDHFQVYFEGCPKGPHGEVLRRHGDGYRILDNGFYECLGRVDDTFKLAGIKTGSVPIERALLSSPLIHRAVAVGRAPQDGGPTQLLVFAIPSKTGEPLGSDALKAELDKILKTTIDPAFKIHELRIVDEASIPVTASAKTMRRAL